MCGEVSENYLAMRQGDMCSDLGNVYGRALGKVKVGLGEGI